MDTDEKDIFYFLLSQVIKSVCMHIESKIFHFTIFWVKKSKKKRKMCHANVNLYSTVFQENCTLEMYHFKLNFYRFVENREKQLMFVLVQG